MTRRVLRAFLVSTLIAAAGLPVVAAVPPPKLQYDISTLPNGLTVVLSENQVNELLRRARESNGYELTVDLEQRQVRDGQGFRAGFPIDDFIRHCLLEGLDDIDLTLQHEAEIGAYEARRPIPRSLRQAF